MKLEAKKLNGFLSDRPLEGVPFFLGKQVRGIMQTLWEHFGRISRRRPRGLRLCESLPLGDRRFVAVVEYENSRFLLGGTSASLVLLAQLPERSPAQLPTDTCVQKAAVDPKSAGWEIHA